MCGIIAVLRRRRQQNGPDAQSVRARVGQLRPGGELNVEALQRLARELGALDGQLQGPLGCALLIHEPALLQQIDDTVRELVQGFDKLEGDLDAGRLGLDDHATEALNAALIEARDRAWSVQRDRLRTARAVADMAGESPGPAAIEGLHSVQIAFSALDRLEVRGRDSVGVHLLVRGHGLDLSNPEIAALLNQRSDPLFTSGAVRHPDGMLGFVYKYAAEIGELGENVSALRKAVREDELLHRALAHQDAELVVLGHTRWASVGIISEANAHPLDETGEGPYGVAALNGDVDNHRALVDEHGLQFAEEITTDAKVIPALVSAAQARGDDLTEAFRKTVAAFEGSVAIGASAASDPGDLIFALRGSGQALYIGLTDDSYVIASEPYGVIEVCDRYLRMDGETPGNPANAAGSRGQVVRLRGDRAGEVAGIERCAYDGTALPVTEDELVPASITTRDVDRGDFPHFLLKEITESPRSLMKTLRGKIADQGGRLSAQVTLPPAVRKALASGRIRHLLCIGQGTAAVAGQGVNTALREFLADTDINCQALPATELSGFGLRPDMSDTLAVAISQSGTTTDTNRTVDLVRARGGLVLAIVNRRGSDLCDKADGVLYTSDGRDVEMSVASTKAFYAQIAAGFLLAAAIAQELDCGDAGRRSEVLQALRDLPEAMQTLIGRREQIDEAARRLAPPKRYWALVGNGANKIAAEEIRIKLSELCYKSIACDATEDKKHIDLSSEPMILVCAAGLRGSTADDVVKEVAIYRAHQATPIVIADEAEDRFDEAHAVLRVPAADPSVAFVLSALAGHLFGYGAALAIDALAMPLRSVRAAIEEQSQSVESGEELLQTVRQVLAENSSRFHELLREGQYDGHMEARTAVRTSSLLRYASGQLPLDAYEAEHGRAGTPGLVLEELSEALSAAIDELTRPVDAIKHQAKTVTVGISRADEALVALPLVAAVLEAGAPRDRIGYGDLSGLAALDPTVEEVLGYSRYAVSGADGGDTVQQIGKGGIAAQFSSRNETPSPLRGTKHLVARERSLFVAVGRSDGRSVVLVPEVQGGETKGITLLHVKFREGLDAATVRSALTGYRKRFDALQDAVLETEASFPDSLLTKVPVVELLTQPVYELADRFRGQ